MEAPQRLAENQQSPPASSSILLVWPSVISQLVIPVPIPDTQIPISLPDKEFPIYPAVRDASSVK
jgi:hypothetical protein